MSPTPSPESKKYFIHGSSVGRTAAEKLLEEERRRRDHRRRLNMPSCIRCGGPRERRAGLLCAHCTDPDEDE